MLMTSLLVSLSFHAPACTIFFLPFVLVCRSVCLSVCLSHAGIVYIHIVTLFDILVGHHSSFLAEPPLQNSNGSPSSGAFN